jgi:radical SAM protein with 4Fe4S-binding SPASM domain
LFLDRALQLKYYLSRSDRSTKIPIEIFLEPTNQCNLNCLTCPRSLMKREVGFMDFKLFRSIADQLRGCEVVNLFTYGEPLLHPKTDEMVSYFSTLGVRTSITTNGTLLNHKKAKALLEAGLDQIVFSLDYSDAATYEQMRAGAHFEDVLNNIRNFGTLSRQMKRKVVIIISAVITNDLISKLEDFLMLVRKLGAHGQRFERYINVPESTCITAGVREEHSNTHFYLWRKLYIYWNGLVTSCPQYIHCDHEELNIGDLRKESLASVWNGDRIRKMRRQALNGQPIASHCLNCRMPSYPISAVAIQTVFNGLFFSTNIYPGVSTLIARYKARTWKDRL